MTLGFKLIIGFHLLNIVLWTIGQGGAVISYDTVASWGLQDPRKLIDPVIVAVNQGIGLADLIVMIPVFIIAVVGLWRQKFYGAVASWLALGMTIYWPIVFLSSQRFYNEMAIKHQPTPFSTLVILFIILGVALWAIWYLFKNYRLLK